MSHATCPSHDAQRISITASYRERKGAGQTRRLGLGANAGAGWSDLKFLRQCPLHHISCQFTIHHQRHVPYPIPRCIGPEKFYIQFGTAFQIGPKPTRALLYLGHRRLLDRPGVGGHYGTVDPPMSMQAPFSQHSGRFIGVMPHFHPPHGPHVYPVHALRPKAYAHSLP